VLLDVACRYPQLQLDLSFTDRVVDLVEENFDLAVRIAPLAARAGLIARRLGTMKLLTRRHAPLAAHPEWPRGARSRGGHGRPRGPRGLPRREGSEFAVRATPAD
jgi:DNA-binding transcriptional LysR family regulator